MTEARDADSRSDEARMNGARPWLTAGVFALGGAGVMVGLGQLLSLAGLGCTALCRPEFASVTGAVIGLLAIPRRS
jgi:hypothetical protein